MTYSRRRHCAAGVGNCYDCNCPYTCKGCWRAASSYMVYRRNRYLAQHGASDTQQRHLALAGDQSTGGRVRMTSLTALPNKAAMQAGAAPYIYLSIHRYTAALGRIAAWAQEGRRRRCVTARWGLVRHTRANAFRGTGARQERLPLLLPLLL